MVRKQWLEQHEQSSLHCLAQAQSKDDNMDAIVRGQKVGLIIMPQKVLVQWILYRGMMTTSNDGWWWDWCWRSWRVALFPLIDRCLLPRRSDGWSPKPLLETMGLKQVCMHFGCTCAEDLFGRSWSQSSIYVLNLMCQQLDAAMSRCCHWIVGRIILPCYNYLHGSI